jgi:hypothetical protein
MMFCLTLPSRPQLLEPSPPGQATELSASPHPSAEEGSVQGLGVKKDIPRMEMVHCQDVPLELSARLLVAQ